MSQPTPPPSPQPAIKLKVPGTPAAGATSGGPKLKVTTSPFSGPGTPPPTPGSLAVPASPVPTPALGLPTTPPPSPSAPVPAPAAPPAPTQVPPVAPPLPDQPSESPEDAAAANPSKKKGKKVTAPTASAPKSKPSILFLSFDLLIFCGAIALIVLILLKK